MPRVNLGRKKPDKLQLLLNGYVSASGVTRSQLGRIMGMCDDTASKRLKDPRSLSIRELLALSRAIGIPLDELRNAITY